MRPYFDKEKLRAERKKKKLFILKIFLLIFAFVIIIFGGIYFLTFSDFFKVKKIIIENENINQNEFIGKITFFIDNFSSLTRFLTSKNILAWQSKIINEFVSANPEIKSLELKKNFFSRTISLNLQLREKIGLWCQKEKCFWFDKDGFLFKEAPVSEGEIIFKVIDLTNNEKKIKDYPLSNNEFKNLLKIFEFLDKNKLETKTLYLENEKLQEVVAYSLSGVKIYFSLRIDPSFAKPIIDQLKKNGFSKIEYLDLRIKNRGFYKLK